MLSESDNNSNSLIACDSWEKRVVLFIDIVESTRLLEEDEQNTIKRWRHLVSQIEGEVLPSTNGRIVNSLGDGLLLDFLSVASGAAAALRIQSLSRELNDTLPASERLHLRMGMEVADVIVDQHDIYGRGVMLAARLMTLADPGEIVVSVGVRDRLAAHFDADIEDLGECFLKHISQPVRAYRIGAAEPVEVKNSFNQEQFLPIVAVVPFQFVAGSTEGEVISEILTTELTAALSPSANLNVISRLSMKIFKDREWSLEDLKRKLNVNYVISGQFRTQGSTLLVNLELADTHTGHVIWSGGFQDSLASILDASSDLLTGIAEKVDAYLIANIHRQVSSTPWKNIESYKLLLGAITRMHSNSRSEFDMAFKMLEHVTSLATRQSSPYAWMGKWYVLKAQQGWSDDPQSDGVTALRYTQHALDIDPQDTLALTTDGFVHTNLIGRLDIAEDRYARAVAVNPNDSLAWLAKGTLHAFKGEGDDAVMGTQRALMLSPFDPIRYFYDSLAATAKLASGEYRDSLDLAESSLRANKFHTSTLRVKAAAQWKLGLREEAVETGKQLLKAEPNLTVAGWLARSPAREYSIGKDWAATLRSIGIPG